MSEPNIYLRMLVRKQAGLGGITRQLQLANQWQDAEAYAYRWRANRERRSHWLTGLLGALNVGAIAYEWAKAQSGQMAEMAAKLQAAP